HRSPQSTQADPHLMHALGSALEQRRLVVDDLPEAGAANRAEAIARAHAGDDVHRRGLDRLVARIDDQLVAALRFALERELGGERGGKLTGDSEQLGCVAALELELDLAQRRRAGTSVDLAPVDGQCDGPRVVGERIGRALHPWFELWPPPPPALA